MCYSLCENPWNLWEKKYNFVYVRTHIIKGHELQARASVGGLVETTKIVPQIRREAKATVHITPYEKLPKGWAWCRLGDIGEIIGGGTPSTSIEEYWNGEISWITPADLSNYSDKYIAQGKRNITQLGLDNSSAKLIPKGSILFSTRAPIGYVVIADRPLSTNQGFKSLSLSINMSEEFVYYFLLAEKERIKLLASGTTFQELSASAFGKILIPLPPLQEQHRIVEKIESYFSFLDTIESNL